MTYICESGGSVRDIRIDTFENIAGWDMTVIDLVTGRTRRAKGQRGAPQGVARGHFTRELIELRGTPLSRSVMRDRPHVFEVVKIDATTRQDTEPKLVWGLA